MSMLKTEKKPSPPPLQPQRVRLEFIHPGAESICIAGNFNDWRPGVTPMISLGGGRWVKDLSLLPGVYEYCLVVDGEWKPDLRASETLPNNGRTMDFVLKVKENCWQYAHGSGRDRGRFGPRCGG